MWTHTCVAKQLFEQELCALTLLRGLIKYWGIILALDILAGTSVDSVVAMWRRLLHIFFNLFLVNSSAEDRCQSAIVCVAGRQSEEVELFDLVAYRIEW